MEDVNANFQWKCHPQAEQLVLATLKQYTQRSPYLARLESDLLVKTSTRLVDWVDHLIIDEDSEMINGLLESGFVLQKLDSKDTVYCHPGAQLPRVVIRRNNALSMGVALVVDHITDFLMAREICVESVIQGSVFGNYRRCLVSGENDIAVFVVERRGTQTIVPTVEDAETLERYHKALELWESRPRVFNDEMAGIDKTIKLAQHLVDLVGQSRAAWTVLEAERRYWQRRNTAGQVQKNRQDQVGMGWANHDHHTFRSSRALFYKLVHLFEILGFHCRERYYAGQEAGWGAQVMENSESRLVLFLDVDLASNEIQGDFAHQPLPPLEKLNTIGLWCGLHGDSIFQAGMHHLEAQFMFDELTEELSKSGVRMMSPFSTFPYLKQAFTVGENWSVDPERVQRLLHRDVITQEQADQFIREGALGSHLENLQRREGYKGFNQKNVSSIIKKTDPRVSHA